MLPCSIIKWLSDNTLPYSPYDVTRLPLFNTKSFCILWILPFSILRYPSVKIFEKMVCAVKSRVTWTLPSNVITLELCNRFTLSMLPLEIDKCVSVKMFAYNSLLCSTLHCKLRMLCIFPFCMFKTPSEKDTALTVVSEMWTLPVVNTSDCIIDAFVILPCVMVT